MKRTSSLLLALCLSCLLAVTVAATSAHADDDFDAQLSAFPLKVDGVLIPYQIFGVYVMPGEEVKVEVTGALSMAGYQMEAEEGDVSSRAPGHWRWQAPKEPGLYRLDIKRPDGEAVQLNAFVLVPLSEAKNGSLRGYRLGEYPSEPLRGLKAYLPPEGFVYVTKKMASAKVSPHFTLGQFRCKQTSGYPALIALREELLLKLEFLLEKANEAGYRADTFAVLSGFRTPYYNERIGNVKYSRHQWGGAADIFIDHSPRNGVMDDLDGNGKIEKADAELLFKLFDRQTRDDDFKRLIGGLGLYGPTSARGPFVHVDARGFRARWGQ